MSLDAADGQEQQRLQLDLTECRIELCTDPTRRSTWRNIIEMAYRAWYRQALVTPPPNCSCALWLSTLRRYQIIRQHITSNRLPVPGKMPICHSTLLCAHSYRRPCRCAATMHARCSAYKDAMGRKLNISRPGSLSCSAIQYLSSCYAIGSRALSFSDHYCQSTWRNVILSFCCLQFL